MYDEIKFEKLPMLLTERGKNYEAAAGGEVSDFART